MNSGLEERTLTPIAPHLPDGSSEDYFALAKKYVVRWHNVVSTTSPIPVAS